MRHRRRRRTRWHRRAATPVRPHGLTPGHFSVIGAVCDGMRPDATPCVSGVSRMVLAHPSRPAESLVVVGRRMVARMGRRSPMPGPLSLTAGASTDLFGDELKAGRWACTTRCRRRAASRSRLMRCGGFGRDPVHHLSGDLTPRSCSGTTRSVVANIPFWGHQLTQVPPQHGPQCSSRLHLSSWMIRRRGAAPPAQCFGLEVVGHRGMIAVVEGI